MVTNELTFYFAAALLLGLTVESCVKLLKRDSLGIMVSVYVTVFAWYFVDPFLNPEGYASLPSYLLGESYGEVLLFLIGFRLFTPVAARWLCRRRSTAVFAMQRVTPEQVLVATGTIWFLLFAIGIYRLDGDVIGAVFPIDSRGGAQMWGRGAVDTSGSGFLIASAAYSFMAATAFLGILVFFQRTIFWRVLAGTMFAITLPSFFLGGSRNLFLAVMVPFIITYLCYGRHFFIVKLAILAVAFVCLDQGFRIVTEHRMGGFRDLLASENPFEVIHEDLPQKGLNMIEELCFVNTYLGTGSGSLAYGARYLNELLNFIPRVIWPSKPLLGIDYAIWRGFGSDEAELGVNTTISSGMIGGGVLNFGQILGPIAAGILMALWTGLLISWWEQRQSLLRLALFMLGVGLTFNLGRDITLLVLWPVLFAYFFIRLAEIWATKRFPQAPRRTSFDPANLGPMQMSAGRLIPVTPQR